MRQVALFLLTITVSAQEQPSYPDIPVGRSAKQVEIATATWFSGGFSDVDAVVVGEVREVTSEVHQSASQVLPEETCVIQIESMFGVMPELENATTIRLTARYIHDLYLQLEPDWGVYRHLKQSQRVMALLHRYEGKPAIGSDVLIPLTAETASLPQILRRTQLNPAKFTDADLAVVKRAAPSLHEDFVARVEYARSLTDPGDVTALEWTALGAVVLAVVWGLLRLRRRKT